MYGPENPVSWPHFSHKVAFRALVPMDRAVAALGRFKAFNQHMHTGPRAHILHFPVAGGAFLNVVAFADDPSEWPLLTSPDDGERKRTAAATMTSPATRAEVAAVFEGWGPTVSRLVGLLPEELDRWAIFDTHDHPPPSYVSGRVCLAGDAAHATSPHHGAGAGIGVEDALALATLLGRARATLEEEAGAHEPGEVLSRVLELYDRVRPARGRWLVKSSREACDIYEWSYPGTMADWDKCYAEIEARSHRLWYFDINGMLKELEDGYDAFFPPAPSSAAAAPSPVTKGTAEVTAVEVAV